MIDWLSSMSQTYEFYEVDPATWKDKRRLTSILSCKVNRDFTTDTLESASFSTTENFDECYIRAYLIPEQNGIKDRVCLGTFLVQTPSHSFDGRVRSINLDAYSPLLELKDLKPDLGYTVMKDANIMSIAYKQTAANLRAPVVKPTNDLTLSADYTAGSDDSWLTYLIALMEQAEYYYILDEQSRVLFAPQQDTDSLKPVWDYNDDNSSILYPSIEDSYDLYGIPNVVEVIYSNDSTCLYSKAINDEVNSPTSIKSRGREVVKRITNPTIVGTPNQEYLDFYAKKMLKSLNSIQHTLTYSHGYCPVRIGDCVRLNYKKAGITNVKAKVVTQGIECKSGCTVSETAVYTSNLWKE